jgi:hypothetical protein
MDKKNKHILRTKRMKNISRSSNEQFAALWISKYSDERIEIKSDIESDLIALEDEINDLDQYLDDLKDTTNSSRIYSNISDKLDVLKQRLEDINDSLSFNSLLYNRIDSKLKNLELKYKKMRVAG